MHAKEPFSSRLKNLRGCITIKDLAGKSGLSPTALYKAESGEDSVSRKTIEAGYGDLCKNPAQYEELLTLWAMTQSERPVALYRARQALSSVMEQEAKTLSSEKSEVITQMEMMDQSAQRIFTQFSKHFRLSEHTRKMATCWMECTETWTNKIKC